MLATMNTLGHSSRVRTKTFFGYAQVVDDKVNEWIEMQDVEVLDIRSQIAGSHAYVHVIYQK